MNGRPDRREDPGFGRSGPPGTPVPREVLDLNYVYEALSHRRRRYLCRALRERRTWSLTDLAATVAAWEDDAPAGPVDESRRERTYRSLYHAHVPKLAALDVVAFDESTERVSAARNADSVLAALDGIGAGLGDARETGAGSPTDAER